jgi:magnesium-transporting ATPase (P-type)
LTVESKEPNQESRWKRPTVYVTVVAIYLIVAVAIILSSVVYAWYDYSKPHKGDLQPGSAALGGAILGVIFDISLIVSFLSIIGSIALFYREKIGLWISLAALILMIFILPLLAGFSLETFMEDNGYNLRSNSTIFLMYAVLLMSFVSVVAMFPLLVKGRKSLLQKKKN